MSYAFGTAPAGNSFYASASTAVLDYSENPSAYIGSSHSILWDRLPNPIYLANSLTALPDQAVKLVLSKKCSIGGTFVQVLPIRVPKIGASRVIRTRMFKNLRCGSAGVLGFKHGCWIADNQPLRMPIAAGTGVWETHGSHSRHLSRPVETNYRSAGIRQSFFLNWECTVMARVSWMQRLYWRYLSKPAAFRDLYLHAIDHPIGSILEIGMGSGQRIQNVLDLCHLPTDVKQLRYAAVDPFESAGPGQGRLTLKGAHRMLSERGVKAHLIPGDPISGVMRVAHTVLPSDLVIIDGHWGDGSPESEVISKWLPRLCHSQSTIFASKEPGERLERVAIPAVGLETATRAA